MNTIADYQNQISNELNLHVKRLCDGTESDRTVLLRVITYLSDQLARARQAIDEGEFIDEPDIPVKIH